MGVSGPSILIESTDSMIFLLNNKCLLQGVEYHGICNVAICVYAG